MLPSRSFYCTINHCHSDRDCTLPAVGVGRCGVPCGGTVCPVVGQGQCRVPCVGAGTVWSAQRWGGGECPVVGAWTVQSAPWRNSAECPAVGR